MTAHYALAASDTGVAGVWDWPVVFASLSLVAGAIVLSRWLGLGVEWPLVWASIRAAIQLLAVGGLLALILRSTVPDLWAWVWVAVMVTISSVVMVRRMPNHPGAWIPAFLAVGLSTGIGLGVIFGFGVIPYDPISVVVVAGITMGNAMPQGVLAAKTVLNQARDNPGTLEALLAIGFERREVIRFLAPETARLALVPQIERTKVVGLIALPGAMTGLLLAGVDPVDAVVIQLLVMYLVLGAAAVTVITMVLAVTRATVTGRLQVAEWVRER